jgi:hypothetical protein
MTVTPVWCCLWNDLHFLLCCVVYTCTDSQPFMATIIQRGSKRKIGTDSQRDEKIKQRRLVFAEVEKLKSQGIQRGLYASVARQLNIDQDKVRNLYKAEEKLVKSGQSSEDYLRMSAGEPTTKVILLVLSFL